MWKLQDKQGSIVDRQIKTKLSCSRMPVGKYGRKAMIPLPSVNYSITCALNILYEATCMFPVVVSGIFPFNPEVIVVLSLHLPDINWLFLSSRSSNSSSSFVLFPPPPFSHFLSSNTRVQDVLKRNPGRDER